MIWTSEYMSPLGRITLACDDEAIVGLWFNGQRYFGSVLPEVTAQREHPLFAEAGRWLDIYFSGKEPGFLPPLRYDATPFRRLICDIMLTIPYGKTMTYGAIAAEGLRGDWGANIGSTLLSTGSGIETEARAWAAAGSDARMNGCEMPVVICSGSGNQGITASVPVVVYAEELGVSRETLYRALAVSNLSTIHIKAHIGTLSAYCGAVSAGCGAGAGITYLYGGGYEQIKHTLVNAMAITSGIICDGAKPSCAAKIATSVDAGLLGYHMYRCGNQFYAGDGIVKSGIEHTIETVGALAHTGMADTDRQIIRLMMEP